MREDGAAPSPFSRHPDFTAVVFLLVAVLLLFNRFLDPSGHWVLSHAGDLTKQFVWWRQFGFGELRKGHLVLWNPHLFSGAPFFGGFQSALLYPPNWLFMVLPLGFALNFSIAFHVFLAGWFTYLWLKGRNTHPASALLGAFMFMFSGAYFTRLAVGQIPNLCTMVWIPLVFLALDQYRDTGGLKWIGTGIFALALQFFSGHVQYCYYTGMAAFFYALLTMRFTDKKARYLMGFLLLYTGASLLAAVQLLAGWDAAFQSVRTQHMSLGSLDVADMTVERAWCFFMPNFFGSWDNYWGGGMYWEGHPYVSVTGFVLALFALRSSPRPEKGIFAGLALFFLLLSFGNRTPLFPLFAKYFPLFGSFRGVSKLNILTTICLTALAAMGLDEVFKRPETLKGLRRGTTAGAAVFGLVALLFYAAPRLGWGRLFKQFLSHSDEMAWNLLAAGLLLGVIALTALMAIRKPTWRWGFLGLVFLELFSFAWENRPSFDLQALRQKIAPIQQTYDRDPGDYRVCVQGGNYTLGTSGLDIWGEDPILPLRYALFVARTEKHDYDHIIDSVFSSVSPPLGLLRLRYVFLQEGDEFVPHRTGFKETPRVFLADRWEVQKWEDILDKITANGFDPMREVLLESDPGLGPPSGKIQGDIAVKDLSTEQIEITAQVPKPAVLVMTDNDSHGWRALPLENSDQKIFSILPAYGFFRAVPLQAGHQHFLMEYRPTAYVVGKWISIISWLVFLGFLLSQGSPYLRKKG